MAKSKMSYFFLWITFVALTSAVAGRNCKASQGTSAIQGNAFYKWEASSSWESGPVPTYDPLKKVWGTRGLRNCRKTCESSKKCAAWMFQSAGSSGGGNVYCSLYEADEYEVKTGADVCTGRLACRTGVCK